MNRFCIRRLAGGASAILANVALLACEASSPTDVGHAPTRPAIVRHAMCDVTAMPTYALANGAWTDGDRIVTHELYMEHGRLREQPPAHIDDTLDLRGLTLVRAPARDDIATFVGLRDARDTTSVALRVTQGCVIW